MKTQVAIVGGGMVGLCLANALLRNGVECLLVDHAPAPVEPLTSAFEPGEQGTLSSGISPRVSAINPASRDFLSSFNVWQQMAPKQLGTFSSMQIWDGDGAGSVEFETEGLIVENKRIEAALWENLPQKCALWETSVVDISVEGGVRSLSLADGRVIECQLLVGADGSSSRIREAIGFRTFRREFPQSAIVTTVLTEGVHDQVARQCFTPNGPLALLPLANEKLCSVVWSSDITDELMSLSSDAFCSRLSMALDSVLGPIRACDERFTFPLIQQHALTYVKEGVALVGDAAHSIHPLAGQGVNLGFADVKRLAQEVAAARLEGRPLGDLKGLRNYQIDRLPRNMLMATATESLQRLFEPRHPVTHWLRNSGLRTLDRNEIVKSWMVRIASGY